MKRTPPSKSPAQSGPIVTPAPRNKRQRPNNSPASPLSEYGNKQEEMMAMLSKLLTEVAEVRKSNDEIQKMNGEMQKSLEFHIKNYEEINTRVTALETGTVTRDAHILKLENRIDELERQARSTCLEVRGIPMRPNETKQDLTNIVEKLHSKTRANVTLGAIKDVYRTKGKPNGERPIIIDFASSLQKVITLQAIKKFNASNTTDRLSTSALDIVGEKNPVYVSEFLTPKARRLYFLAREVATVCNFNFCWTTNGRIFLRKAEGSPPIVITSEQQIEELKQKN